MPRRFEFNTLTSVTGRLVQRTPLIIPKSKWSWLLEPPRDTGPPMQRRRSIIPKPNLPSQPRLSRKPATPSSNSSSLCSSPISSSPPHPPPSPPPPPPPRFFFWPGVRRASTSLQDRKELMVMDPLDTPEGLDEAMEVD
ncbi:uncharacterized protein [Clinocottus analis]|uniref:uncharacterized protein isoform X2 n=1 Tax=Clinocottus analis TaxID=304258 RepID=UPI0035BFBC6E